MTKQMRINPHASLAIRRIAEILYDKYRRGHNSLGVRRASSRVAIEYVLSESRNEKDISQAISENTTMLWDRIAWEDQKCRKEEKRHEALTLDHKH